MSGQPYKTALDITNARNSYLSNLKLQIELDDKNYQANKLYKRTGQLPVEMTDYRSVTEKLADVQRLKIDLNSKLLAITDGQQAQSITTQLNAEQLLFLSQNFGPISEQMKKIYSVGVLAPIFINYLQRYMERFQLTQGVELGLQQSSANNIIANQQTIINTMARRTDIDNIIGLINSLGATIGARYMDTISNLREIKDLINVIPNIFSQISQENNAIQQSQMRQILNNIVSDLPNHEDLNRYFDLLSEDIKNNNKEGIYDVLTRLNGITQMGQDTKENIEILKQLINEYKPVKSDNKNIHPGKDVPIHPGKDVPIQPDVLDKRDLTAEEEDEIRNVMAEYPNKTREELLRDFNEIWDDLGDTIKTRYKSKTEYAQVVIGKRYTKNLSKIDLLNLIQDLYTILLFGVIDYSGKKYYTLPESGKQIPEPDFKPIPIPQEGKGMMRGKGIVKIKISRKHPSQVLDTDIDYSLGIIKAPKFVPIGKHLINKHRLDDNIVAIKRQAGSVIPSLPSQRVSNNVAEVLRKILGGKAPTYDDFNELNNDDKLILDKIAKETQIKDRIQLPKPIKAEQDKDSNQFEILKGEILAGNDNPDIVKKFKTIILKLSHQNLLPKGQAKELLMDLINLGH